MEGPGFLHMHRLDHNSSKLPTFRHADVLAKSSRPFPGNAPTPGGTTQVKDTILASLSTIGATPRPDRTRDEEKATTKENQKEHLRVKSDPAVSTSLASRPLPLPPPPETRPSQQNQAQSDSTTGTTSQKRKGSLTLIHSGNGYLGKGPPPAMLTQKSQFQSTAASIEPENPTEDWVVHQSALTASSPVEERKSQSDSQPVTPLIPPIRGFKTSRKSTDAISPRLSGPTSYMDQDDTLRAQDGLLSRRFSSRDQEEQSSDDSDLFLKLAREEATGNNRSGPIRRSQMSSNRQSLPPNHTIFQSTALRRRGSDYESTVASRQTDDHVSQALNYRPTARERVPAALDTSKNRYQGGTTISTPVTPRAATSREISPESQVSYGGRRPSVPEQGLPPRTSYRQSNLSYSTPRGYNSSPLVSRVDGGHESVETQRAAEGTESSVSTTAPSTVWDELEDLKSRINRLELTGKLPPTSGAAVSRASNDRPPTATTTITTMSSSPKRGRGNSVSPVDSHGMEPNDAHPLLHAALAKSKTLLSPEIYNALEATAVDALSISAMMGTSGQVGPIASSHSTVGVSATGVSDRQVRRKADSMCRSLTELCLALSEGKNDPVLPKQVLDRPKSRDAEIVQSVEVTQRQPPISDLARVKASPRALSRLEARRSSLLATSTLPSPRYTPSEAVTPTQSSMAGRRTSLMLRSRRGATEEPEEEDDARFRAPSRATTDLGRVRNSPREYNSQPPSESRVAPIQSSLPVRRHYASSSLTNTTSTIPAVSGRRYLERATPERDTTSLAGRMTQDRGERKSSISQGFPLGRNGSITRKTRQPNGDSQGAGYQ